MINVNKLVPTAYYDNSRDFQTLGRFCELLYNYMFTNTNLVLNANVSDDTNLSLIDLALHTLGFFQTHEYTNVDLLMLAQIFKYIMKVKGTKSAIEYSVYLLLRSQSIEIKPVVDIKTISKKSYRPSMDSKQLSELYTIDLWLPKNVKDSIMIEDLFDYILPAGFVYNIYYSDIKPTTTSQKYDFVDNVEKDLWSNSSKQLGQINSNNDLNRTYHSVVANSDSILSNDGGNN